MKATNLQYLISHDARIMGMVRGKGVQFDIFHFPLALSSLQVATCVEYGATYDLVQ